MVDECGVNLWGMRVIRGELDTNSGESLLHYLLKVRPLLHQVLGSTERELNTGPRLVRP